MPPQQHDPRVEIGVVGGEDGVEAKHDAKLYSTPEDGLLASSSTSDSARKSLPRSRDLPETSTASTSRAT